MPGRQADGEENIEAFAFDVVTANGNLWRVRAEAALVSELSGQPLHTADDVEHVAHRYYAALQFGALRAIARAKPGSGTLDLNRHDLRI